MEENKNIETGTENKEPRPGTKAYVEAELAAAKAELEALKAQKAEAAVEPAASEAPKETGPKMVKIKIPRTKKDEEDVFVSVNLYTCIIKRGVEVEVPDFVYEVLCNQEKMLEEIMLFDEANQKGN